MGIIMAAIGAITAAVSILAKIGLAIEGLKVVASVFISIAKALGIIKPKTTPEELGAKAIIAEEDGIIPSNFENMEAYLKHIDSMELDEERAAKISYDDKIDKASKILSAYGIEKFGENNVDALLRAIDGNEEYFTDDRISAISSIISNGIKKGEEILGSVAQFLNPKATNAKEFESAFNNIASIEKAADPSLAGLSDGDILSKIKY